MAPVGKPPENGASLGEKIIASLAATACVLLTLRIWSLVAAAQNVWLLPAFYFLELIALSLACAVAYWVGMASRRIMTWMTLGILVAFSLLGAWSIGLYYVPGRRVVPDPCRGR